MSGGRTISASPSSRSASPSRGRASAAIRVTRGPDDVAAREDLELNAAFTVAEMLRNGITTFVEFGSQRRVQEALHEQVGKLGIRAYLGPGFDSGRWVGGEGGKLVRVVDEAAGWQEFRGALEFIEQTTGDHNDLVRGILVPREVETCTVDLMRRQPARRRRASCRWRSTPPTTSTNSST